MMKKGQSALEFLTTYGWAFVVLLTAIGALSYFGLFNIQPPDRCTLGVEFGCHDYKIMKANEPQVVLVISNGKDFTMNVSHFVCTFPDESTSIFDTQSHFYIDPLRGSYGTNGTAPLDAGGNWAPGEKRYAYCKGSAAANGIMTIGEKTKVRFTITYTNQDVQGFDHSIDGEVIAKVQAP